MNFVNPELLWLIPIIVTIDLVCLILAAKKRSEMLLKLLGEDAANPAALHLSRARRIWRNLLMLAVLMLLIIAAARPCRTFQLRQQETKGRDFIVLFDVSKSMNAADLQPSRLEHAKMMLIHLADQNPEDRFGLVAFAGTAYLSCPLTSDPATFTEYVRELSSDTIPVGGTNIESALLVAERAFKAAESNNRAILLLTDGEELQGDAKHLIAELRKRHVPLFIAGFGDPDTGAPVPTPDENGNKGFVRDKAGKIVTTKLNEKILAELARETGGIYVRSTAIRPGTELFQKAMGRLDRIGKEKLKRRIPVDEFPKILIGCAILLLLYLLISERPWTRAKKSAALLAFTFFALGAAKPAPAKPEVPKVPEDTVACYNLARSMQESGNPGFEALYEEVLKRNNVSPELRSKSFHNLGAAVHNNLRSDFRKAVASLRAQQPDQSLKELGEAEKKASPAEELYRSSAVSGAENVPALGGNLSRLDADREQIKQLKKKIEELKKQQQKARDKAKQAQKEQPQNQQNQQQNKQNSQNQQQNSALNQAKQEAQKLQNQAQKMQQQRLAKDAQKAAQELDKAQHSREKKDEKSAQKHIQEALKALGEEQKQKQDRKQPQPQNSGKDQKKSAAPQPVQAGKQEKKEDKTGTKQLLQMLKDEEKELRDAIRQRNRMRRAPVEKDW